jgi:hypothetical protein
MRGYILLSFLFICLVSWLVGWLVLRCWGCCYTLSPSLTPFGPTLEARFHSRASESLRLAKAVTVLHPTWLPLFPFLFPPFPTTRLKSNALLINLLHTELYLWQVWQVGTCEASEPRCSLCVACTRTLSWRKRQSRAHCSSAKPCVAATLLLTIMSGPVWHVLEEPLPSCFGQSG